MKMVITSNTECTIFMNDFTQRKFDVLFVMVSEDGGKTFKPAEMDTSMSLMVTSVKKDEEKSGFIKLNLECNDNIKCIVSFSLLDDYQSAIVIKDSNLIIAYTVEENTEQLRSRIRREDE